MSCCRGDPQKVASCLHNSLRTSAKASEKVGYLLSYHAARLTAFGIRSLCRWASNATTGNSPRAARERSFGPPARTNASESRSPGAGAPLEKCSPSTNHNTPAVTNCPIIGLEGLLGLVELTERFLAASASEREEGSRCTSKERYPPASERRPAACAVAQAAAGQPSSPAVAAQSTARAQARRIHADTAEGGGRGA